MLRHLEIFTLLFHHGLLEALLPPAPFGLILGYLLRWMFSMPLPFCFLKKRTPDEKHFGWLNLVFLVTIALIQTDMLYFHWEPPRWFWFPPGHPECCDLGGVCTVHKVCCLFCFVFILSSLQLVYQTVQYWQIFIFPKPHFSLPSSLASLIVSGNLCSLGTLCLLGSPITSVFLIVHLPL